MSARIMRAVTTFHGPKDHNFFFSANDLRRPMQGLFLT